jgi:hypothetical protein
VRNTGKCEACDVGFAGDFCERYLRGKSGYCVGVEV